DTGLAREPCRFNRHHSRRGSHSSRQRSSCQSFAGLRSLPNRFCTAVQYPFAKLRMNCEWVESVPGIAIDKSKGGLPGINALIIFPTPLFVERVWQQRRRLVEHRGGKAPTVRGPDSIQSDGATFGSDLENDLGFIHGRSPLR